MQLKFQVRSYVWLFVLVSQLFVEAFAAENFGDRTPTVEEIEHALTSPMRMRGIKPGAAAKLTPPPSISMKIPFTFDSDQLSEAARTKLANVVTAFGGDALGSKSFEVIGHTDASGSEDYNLALSRRRANSVREYLISAGIKANRLTSIGKGESELLNERRPEAAENRRVEFKLKER